MNEDRREVNKLYVALKLVEVLFHKGLIGKTVFRNILSDYSGKVDLSDFKGYM